LQPQQALQFFQQGRFTQVSSQYVNVGFTRSVYWLAFNYAASTASEVALTVGDAHINILKFYYVDKGQPQLLTTTGDYFHFEQRPLTTALYNFPIKKQGLYLLQVDKHYESLQLSFSINSIADIIEVEASDKLF